MALRSFTAPDGTTWRAWQVNPRSMLQGGPQRRVRERRGQDVLLYRGPERRVAERRRRAEDVAGLPAGMEAGWLAFEADGAAAKRRLAPPPAGWEELPDGELVELWRRAAPVPALRPPGSAAAP